MTTCIFGGETAPNVLIQAVYDSDPAGIENETKAIRERTDADFRLIAVKVSDWNRDLAPWQAPPAFGNKGFGGNAAKTLEEILTLCSDRDRNYIIGGYSLAGLFALWAVTQTDRFAGAAAASPSVWFPGFTEYMEAHEIRCRAVYLSLGDREERTRNQMMAAVGSRIRKAEEILKGRGIQSILEWNPGNHFRDADLRTAKAFAWVLNQEEITRLPAEQRTDHQPQTALPAAGPR